MDINDKIQFWKSEIERAEEHGIFFDPQSVAEVVKTVEDQQQELEDLKEREEFYKSLHQNEYDARQRSNDKIKQQQKDIEMLKKEEAALYKTFAAARDILLSGIDKNNNVCGDMEASAVSNIECLECLAREAVKQLKELHLEVERLQKIETHLDRELLNEYSQNEFLKMKIERLNAKEHTQKK